MTTGGIVQAIVAVMNDVTSVPKGDQFNGGATRYAYRGVDRVVTALSASMRKHGLVMLPDAAAPVSTAVTTSQGKPANRVELTVTYRLYCAASGESLAVTVAAEAMDSSDKAVSKAMSVAWRTALLQTFFLPTDEPDPDSENVELGQQIPGGASPETQARLRGYDEREAAMRADWQAAIEQASGDKAALTDLWKRATAARIPKDIIQTIEAEGNKLP